MKRLTYIMLSLCCFALYSCDMTEPWKDWENEGNMSEDRLRPSEVKELLCAVDGWKTTYEGVTFYFQFNEEGIVNSDSDGGILENAVETDYTLDFRGERIVLLTLQNGGMMQYLAENQENTFVITSYSDSQIVATGQKNGKEVILFPVTAAEVQQAQENKQLAIIARRKEQVLDLFKNELNNGVFRKVSSAFMAHYLITCDEENRLSVKVSAIVDGVVKHTEYPMTVDTSGDEDAVLTFGDNVTIGGVLLNKFYYNYLNGVIRTNDVGVVCDIRKASDIAIWYTSDDWRTHIVDQEEIHEDFKGIFHDDVEFDDRNPRNMVVCPWDGMGSYIGIMPSVTTNDETGRIFIQWGETYDMFGWNNNPADYALVQSDYEKFLSFCSSGEGLYWTTNDTDNMMYVLSATGEQWFRMRQ